MNSSQILTIVAVLAIAFAAFNLIITIDKVGKLTGYASNAPGTANLTILSNLDINFTVYMINWSSGYIAGTNLSGSLNTENGNINVTGFQSINKGLELESLSSTNISVNLTSDKNGNAFLSPDPSATFEWKSSQNESNSCALGLNPSFYQLVTVSPTQTTVCSNLQFYPDKNSMEFDLRVNFTKAAIAGAKGAVITATAWCGVGNCL